MGFSSPAFESMYAHGIRSTLPGQEPVIFESNRCPTRVEIDVRGSDGENPWNLHITRLVAGARDFVFFRPIPQRIAFSKKKKTTPVLAIVFPDNYFPVTVRKISRRTRSKTFFFTVFVTSTGD